MRPEPVSTSRSIYLGPWRIDITTRPDVPRLVSLMGLSRMIGSALEAARSPRPASIGLILADDAELAGLNATHMGKAGPTDVLSFPLLPNDAFPVRLAVPPPPHGRSTTGPAFALPPGRRLHLGDMVVSVERAIEQAGAGRGGQTGNVTWSPAEELLLLVAHGTLHMCGWDHAEPADEAAMRALEQRLLARG